MSQSIASRAALRTLPAAMAVVGQTLKNIDGDRLLLVCARATLTSGVASTCAALDVERVTTAALSAADSAAYFADDPSFSNAFVARCAAHSAISASSNFPSPAHYARFAVHSVQTSASPTAAAFDATVFQTATQWELFDAVLWPQEHAVQEFIEQWSVFDQRQDPKGIWTFWKQWYRGMMEGVPLDWGLQLRVALIEDEIWKSGPEAVAREIERIQVKHELELEIAALRGQLAEAKQLFALPNRLHNHHGNEEMFLILQGEGRLKFGSEEFKITKDDVIACPAGGQSVAHQISNDGEEDLLYLALSTKNRLDICEFPADGRVAVQAGDYEQMDFSGSYPL